MEKKPKTVQKSLTSMFKVSPKKAKAPATKIIHEQEDLYCALKNCNEIGSAKTLYAFLHDVKAIRGSRTPS